MANKNLRTFVNKPLIAHSIIVAKESQLFEDVIVSTDSQEYADVAKQYGASVPFLRPANLAQSHVPTSEVTVHTLNTLKEAGKSYSAFAVLAPTSPLRTISDLQKSYQLLLDKRANIIISVAPSSIPAEWCNHLQDDLNMKNFISPTIRNKPRQHLKPSYVIHGGVFWALTEPYLANQDPYQNNAFAYIMKHEQSVDIDTELDFLLAELIYKKMNNIS